MYVYPRSTPCHNSYRHQQFSYGELTSSGRSLEQCYTASAFYGSCVLSDYLLAFFSATTFQLWVVGNIYPVVLFSRSLKCEFSFYLT